MLIKLYRLVFLQTICLRDKVRKKANVYYQVPHLTQDTTWESDKTQENITYKSA